MHCEEARRLIHSYVDGELDLRAAWRSIPLTSVTPANASVTDGSSCGSQLESKFLTSAHRLRSRSVSGRWCGRNATRA